MASVYWFTIEFGVLKEGQDVKAYGAGLLSSFGEMEWACDANPSEECRKMGSVSHLEKPTIKQFIPNEAATQEFPITTYQPIIFMADSMADAKTRFDVFCDGLTRPFFPQYDPLTQSIRVTKAVKRAERTSTLQLQAEKQAKYFETAEA